MRKMLFWMVFGTVELGMEIVYGQTNVAIETFAVVSTNASTNVVVTVTPSNMAEDVVIDLRCLQGSGEANFLPGGSTVTNIRQSTTLTVKGKSLSNVASNMIMEVKLGTNILATNIFTVVDTGKIGFVQARALAEQAIAGIVQPEAGAPITVELIDDGTEYLVTFDNIQEEDVLKGEFSAQVRIGASAGNVLDIEGGP